MNKSAPAELLDRICMIAREAGEVIMPYFESDDLITHRKSDRSQVTAADRAAETLIIGALSKLTPGTPIVAEEAVEAGHVPDVAGKSFWLVDPLDGTKEFIQRIPEFTVNIALVENGVAVFGVIQAPVTGVLWHGAPGHGAFRRDGDGERALHVRRPALSPLRVAASRSHLGPRTTALMARMGATDTVGLGSSLKFCRIAEGGMDVYPRFGPTSEWDTAAGQAILEAAGGALLDPRGRPFRYNQRDTLLNGDFIALGDPALPWRDWLGPEAG